MKILLTIVFLKIAVGGVCQDLAFITKSLDLIQAPGDFKPDSTGLYKLPQFDYICLKNIMNDERVDENFLQLIDLNKDKQIDILFSGPCNPYLQVGIFLNRGTYLQSVFDRGGEIVDIDQDGGTSKIYVLYQGCCGDINNEIIEVTIDDNSRISRRSIQFFESTKPNGKIDPTELMAHGVLRKTMEIDDSPTKDPDSNNVFIGNQIIKWDKPKKVIQLQTKGDWSLVLVEKEKDVFALGWIMRSK